MKSVRTFGHSTLIVEEDHYPLGLVHKHPHVLLHVLVEPPHLAPRLVAVHDAVLLQRLVLHYQPVKMALPFLQPVAKRVLGYAHPNVLKLGEGFRARRASRRSRRTGPEEARGRPSYRRQDAWTHRPA